jgi:hypothetical protein
MTTCLVCDHDYGAHYTTFNGYSQGCHAENFNDNGSTRRCDCNGYAEG